MAVTWVYEKKLTCRERDLSRLRPIRKGGPGDRIGGLLGRRCGEYLRRVETGASRFASLGSMYLAL